MRDQAVKTDDVDLKKHLLDLDSKHLRNEAWITQPLQEPENNLVSELVERYLADLRRRTDLKDPATILRRIIDLKSVHEKVQETFDQTVELRQKIKQREEQIKLDKQRELLAKRVGIHTNSQLGMSRKYVFKR